MRQEDDDMRLPERGNVDSNGGEPGGEMRRTDVAIIGISGIFAGSASLEAFWNHLQAGRSCIEAITRKDWQMSTYAADTNASLCKRGGMLQDIDQFDPLFFNISPLEAERMDPQQRLFLEEAYKAFEDAGYSTEQLAEKKVSVFVGARTGDYRDLQPVEMDAHLFLGNDLAMLAARISYFLNLKGPSLTIDTASSSSLVAIHLACESLRSGESTMALAGGVFVMSSPQYYLMAAKTQMLSPDGTCKTFDRGANGIVLGEGVGTLVLKPLGAAIADRDHIYGVIKGSAINQDGRTKGITAPDMLAQKALLVSLYQKTGINPETISYIEAHGTGSKLGDPVEVQALTEAFRFFTKKTQFCAIGSHKPNIGHTVTSAGIAGVCKVLLAMKYQQIPPTINIEEVNPQIDFQGSPFFVNRELVAWKSRDGSPRRAGISSFSLNGTNCHVIIEEPPLQRSAVDQQRKPYYFFPLSAKTKTACLQKVRDMVEWLDKEGGAYSIEDISYTLVQGRSHFSVRSAVVARDIDELKQALREIISNDRSEYDMAKEEGAELFLQQYGQWLLSGLLETTTLLDQQEYKEKLQNLANVYRKGYMLDWSQLFQKGRYYRVPLPTYPFLRESYWITEISRDEENKVLLHNASIPSSATDPGCASSQESRNISVDRLREALKHRVCDLLKVPLEHIDTEKELSEYGFDSITFIAFANRLNQIYQLDLTPAHFYEYTTLARLAQHLHEHYHTILAPHFAPTIATQKCVDEGLAPARPLRASQPTPMVGVSRAPGAIPIAIIGMSGAFPLAADVQSLWHNLLEGKDCISEIPPTRWDWRSYYGNPATPHLNKTNVKWAGIMEEVEQFDPLFFGISPREAEQMDPQQRLLMMHVWKAIEDAGYEASSLSGTNTALFVGTTSSGYNERVSRAHMAIEGYSATGQTPSVGPNRMSYFLNLHGPSEAIETACSSSLVAIQRGVSAIESGQCGIAIVGGVNTLISPDLHISYSKAGMLSEDGRCKAFSAQANGYVRSEGVGMLVLKRLSDAEQAGDHIYGVIIGSAENHGGRATSLTAPNPRAQADLLLAAYHKANIDPRTITYIEAHGTGTPLGDPIEINGLKTAFSELAQTMGEGPLPQESCGIGSVKSNIGHLELAAGVAGVIKVLLQLQHKKLVKSLHCAQINPYIQLEATPFYIVQENREWQALQDHAGNPLPRRAGISSFGFGGANAHVLLEEYVPGKPLFPSTPLPPALIVLSARNEERLHEQVRQLLAWLQAGGCTQESLGLHNLAYTLQVGREAMEERLALQVDSLVELEEKLGHYLRNPQEGTGEWYRGQVKRYKELVTSLGADEELQEAIVKWLRRGKYERLLEWWVKGLKIPWAHLYGEQKPQRISLPTYPFAKECYWVDLIAVDQPDKSHNLCSDNTTSQEEVCQTDASATVRTMFLTPIWQEDALVGPHISQETTLPITLILLCDLPDIAASSMQAQMTTGGYCRTLSSAQSRRELRFQDTVVQLIQALQHLLQARSVTAAALPYGPMLVQLVVADREEPSLLAALTGVLKTAQQEYPQLAGQLIEVEGEVDEETLRTRLRENQYRPQQSHIRYRNGKRWVKLWQEHPAIMQTRPKASYLPWKEGGCYLITGGAGALARLFVQEIAQQVREATIFLIGRSELSAEQCAALMPAGSHGISIEYQEVDVSDGPAVHALMQRIQQKSGHLNGIIHAAGVLRDSLLRNKTAEEVQAVLSPKVIGVEVLDEQSREMPLDFFVLYSSFVAVGGNVGQADYAAANAYLDAFAHARAVQVLAGERQGETVSINWPLWEEGGMHIESTKREMMRVRLGLEEMGTQTGRKALYQALALRQAQVLVLYGQAERIKQHWLQGGDFPIGIAPVENITDPELAGRQDARTVLPTDKLREALVQIVSDLLNVPLEQIDAETELSEYGCDSIACTQFAHRLNQTYQLDLTPPLFYEYTTLERFVQYLQTTYASILAPYFSERGELDSGKPSLPQGYTPISADLSGGLGGGQPPSGVWGVPEKEEKRFFGDTPNPARGLPSPGPLLKSAPTGYTPTEGASSIAIIGMSGVFPQTPDVQSLWANLLEGRDCIGEIPASRWDWQTYFGSTATTPHSKQTNIKWAGVVEEVELFDPLFFGISPREAELMDPQQRLIMTHVWKAIEDAGYSTESLSGSNTALFVGTASSGYHERIPRVPMTIESYASSCQAPSMGPNRMSYFLNLHGPSEAIDTACSSSLVALHRGVNAIESGQCDMAIVGGVNTLVSPEWHVSLSKAGMLSEDGRCKTFSSTANGYVRSEGVGMLVLKRLSDAEQAGDHIYGVIIGSAENHGGRASSLTAPNPRAQADLLITAYCKAGLDPRTVSYIEAHGTGTALGDPVEVNGLKTAFSELMTSFPNSEVPTGLHEPWCGIGAIKSNLGHLELASGVAGVIKVLLQMQYKKLVKSLHCEQSEQINPYIQLEGSPFYIVQENREWEALQDHAGNTLPRRAGVSSFGFGGANAHVILEEYIPIPSLYTTPVLPALIVLSARTEDQLHEQVRQLLAWVEAETSTGQGQWLQDIAYTLQVGRSSMEERLALQVNSLVELKEKLHSYLQELQETGPWYRGQVSRYKETVAPLNADNALQEACGKWFQQGEYEKLLQWWVKGLNISWEHLYGERRPRRISLPTYPFAQKRYWIPAPTRELMSSNPSTFAMASVNPQLAGGSARSIVHVSKTNGHAETLDKPHRIVLRSLAEQAQSSVAESWLDLSSSRSSGNPEVIVQASSPALQDLQAETEQMPLSVQILEEELTRSLAQALYIEPSDLAGEKPFGELGLDSVVGIEWIQTLNKQYATKLAVARIYDYPTIHQFASFLQKELIKHQQISNVGTGQAQGTVPVREGEEGTRHTRSACTGHHFSDEDSPSLYGGGSAYLSGIESLPTGAIAIVGISGKYPDAKNVSEYWQNLVQARDSVREIPRTRFNVSDYYDPHPTASGKMYCKELGALEGIEYFDPLFFRLSPANAESMDPQHRLFLEEGYKAFEDAGYSPGLLSNSKCGVYLGIMSHEYEFLLAQQQALATNILGTNPAIAAARIAYLLNLKGPAIPIDTACSSSLVATHLACQALKSQEIDMALVGGVSLYLTPESYIGMCSAGMLSPDGRCKTCDASANGFVPGEGVGALVLKRLSDAQADHDQIYGVIIGSGINQDGTTSGITAPNVKSQIELEREIYEKYEIDPASISYVEMHGTGTQLGDPIELEALATVFEEKTPRKQYCALGSVKSNIGHTSAAAGMASVHKVLLSMQQKKLVPSLHFKQPNPHFDFAASPFYVNTAVRDWQSEAGAPRRAAVSSFGYSGTNAHLVIEEYIPARNQTDALRNPKGTLPVNTQTRLFVLSAKSEQQLISYAQETGKWIQEHAELALTDIAFTLQLGREAMEHRLAIEASSREMLLQRLGSFVHKQASAGVYTAQIKKGNKAHFSEENNEQSLLHLWYQGKDLAKIAQAWVEGAQVDWKLLYTPEIGSEPDPHSNRKKMPSSLPYRVSLPTYPFKSERYWVPTATRRGDPSEQTGLAPIMPSIPALLHPLVQYNTSTLRQCKFSSTFRGDEFFLADHVVNGQRIMLGVAYLEMAWVAIDQAMDGTTLAGGGIAPVRPAYKLCHIVWTRPLICHPIRPITVHITLSPQENGMISFLVSGNMAEAEPGINSMTPQEVQASELVYCQGMAKPHIEEKIARSLDLGAIQVRCRELSASAFYQRARSLGITYGPALQGIEQLYVGEGEVLARLRLPVAPGLASGVARTRTEGNYRDGVVRCPPPYVLHPTILDSALQACSELLIAQNTCQRPFVPFALDELSTVSEALQDQSVGPIQGWAWVRCRQNAMGMEVSPVSTLVFDIDVCDDEGRITLRLRGFSARMLPEATATDQKIGRDIAQMSMESSHSTPPDGILKLFPLWEPIILAPQVSQVDPVQAVVIVGGSADEQNAIVHAYPYAHVLDIAATSVSIEWLAQHLQALGVIEQVFWLAPYDPQFAPTQERILAAQQQGVLACFRLIKALLQLGYGSLALRWMVITRQTRMLYTTEKVEPTHASLLGLFGSLAKEYSHWRIQQIDLPADAPLAQAEICSKLPVDPQGHGWLYRNGRWYRQILVPLDTSPLKTHEQFRRGGVYVIIGGAGGIGEVVSEYLIRRYQAQIIWLGRRKRDAEILAKQEQLAALGPMPHYITADATEQRAMQQAYQEIKRNFGQIHGVVHSTIVLRDQSLMNMNEEGFQAALAAKVDVSVHLAQIFEHEQLDFVLFFSSLNAFTRNPGQSNYAAACTFEDAFAARLGREWGCSVKVMNWGYWGSVGVVATPQYRAQMTHMGLGSIEPAEAMETLEQLLAAPVNQMALLKTTQPLNLDLLSGGDIIQAEETMITYPERLPSCIHSLHSYRPPLRKPAMAAEDTIGGRT